MLVMKLKKKSVSLWGANNLRNTKTKKWSESIMVEKVHLILCPSKFNSK